jgi:D-3-phosphoglycerate dehydrogenase
MKTFIFDFDSTIFPGETLDEIIQHSLKGDVQATEKSLEITNICNLGMSGTIGMEESLNRRLEIAAPTKENITQYVRDNKDRIETDMKNLLLLIQEKGHQLFVVSGGFEEWIKPLLKGIVPAENIHANQIKNTERPMLFENIARRDKESIINQLLEKRIKPNSPIVIIGDGATDFSVFASGLAQQFVGTFFYTGLEAREKIIEKALDSNQVIFSELDKFMAYMQEKFMN